MPEATLLPPLSDHDAPLSTAIWAKLTNCVPSPDSVPTTPALVPGASSNVLVVVSPPETVPLKLPPGSTMTRLTYPGASFTA